MMMMMMEDGEKKESERECVHNKLKSATQVTISVVSDLQDCKDEGTKTAFDGDCCCVGGDHHCR